MWRPRLTIPLTIIVILAATIGANAEDCKGCLTLDAYSFDKIVGRFRALLVKFDVAYPYGDKHDAFTKLAGELKDVPDLVLAEVGIKDYGDRDNEQLGTRFAIGDKEGFPVVKLFLGSASKVVDFPKTTDFTVENLRNFLRDNADIYIGLPGCLEDYDKLAIEFKSIAEDKKEDKENVLRKSQTLLENETDEVKPRAKTYVIYMKKVLEKGSDFITTENKRLHTLIKQGKVSEKKKEELNTRLNILHSFKVDESKKKSTEEL